MHIEQRARRNRCGAIGDWERSAGAGDAKGARASNSTGRSSTAPSSAAPGQSWNVVSGNLSVLFSFYQLFGLSAGVVRLRMLSRRIQDSKFNVAE